MLQLFFYKWHTNRPKWTETKPLYKQWPSLEWLHKGKNEGRYFLWMFFGSNFWPVSHTHMHFQQHSEIMMLNIAKQFLLISLLSVYCMPIQTNNSFVSTTEFQSNKVAQWSYCLVNLTMWPSIALCTNPVNILEHGTRERAELTLGLDALPADRVGTE